MVSGLMRLINLISLQICLNNAEICIIGRVVVFTKSGDPSGNSKYFIAGPLSTGKLWDLTKFTASPLVEKKQNAPRSRSFLAIVIKRPA